MDAATRADLAALREGHAVLAAAVDLSVASSPDPHAEIARCDRCEQLSVLETMARIDYEDPGTPNERVGRGRSVLAMHLCPQCATRLSKHLCRFFGRRAMTPAEAR